MRPIWNFRSFVLRWESRFIFRLNAAEIREPTTPGYNRPPYCVQKDRKKDVIVNNNDIITLANCKFSHNILKIILEKSFKIPSEFFQVFGIWGKGCHRDKWLRWHTPWYFNTISSTCRKVSEFIDFDLKNRNSDLPTLICNFSLFIKIPLSKTMETGF